MTNLVQEAIREGIRRTVLLTAVDRGMVNNDNAGVPHLNLGPDGQIPVPQLISQLSKAGLVTLMYGPHDGGPDGSGHWRGWRLTSEGVTAVRLDREMTGDVLA